MFKKILIGFLLIGAVVGLVVYQKYQEIYSPNVPAVLENDLVQIPNNSSFEDVLNILMRDSMVIDTASFSWVADKMNYKRPSMRAGQFKIKPGSSNRALISHLRSGKQEPVKVIINNERFVGDVVSNVSKLIAPDSIELMKYVEDESYLSELGFTKENFISMFIPNTYEFYWNVEVEDFFKKIKKEHSKFWHNNNRIQQAKDLNLSQEEVYTLASIVQRETNSKPELPIIAGLYLNRLEMGMLLQADPTVVFANGEFGLRRVLNKHLKYDSPYNTYMYKGLPPGPISMASIAAIDGVLNRKTHDYIFFCAKPDNSGTHAFAKTLAGHNANARKFHNWLNKRGIR